MAFVYTMYGVHGCHTCHTWRYLMPYMVEVIGIYDIGYVHIYCKLCSYMDAALVISISGYALMSDAPR